MSDIPQKPGLPNKWVLFAILFAVAIFFYVTIMYKIVTHGP